MKRIFSLILLLTVFSYQPAHALFGIGESMNKGDDWTNSDKDLHTTGKGTFDDGVIADVLSTDGTKILENGTDGTDAVLTGDVTGDLTGDVLATDGTLVLDNGTDGTDASFIGDIKAENGDVILTSGATGAATVLVGDLTGDVIGDVKATDGTVVLENGTDGSDAVFTGSVVGSVSVAATITVIDESADTTTNVLFVNSATGNLAAKSGTNLTFNSSTGGLTAPSFIGALTGNASTVTNGVYTTDKISVAAD